MLEFLRAWFQWSMWGLKIGWWRLRIPAVDRAFIIVRQGVYYDLELGKRICSNKMGQIYAYSSNEVAYVWTELVKGTTVRQARDLFECFEDERILFLVDGEVLTCPVIGTGVPMDATALSNFNRGDAIKQITTSFRQSSGFGVGSLRLFLIIAAIAIIVFVVWKFVLHGHLPGAAVTPTPTPIPIPTPTSTPIYSWAIWLIQNI